MRGQNQKSLRECPVTRFYSPTCGKGIRWSRIGVQRAVRCLIRRPTERPTSHNCVSRHSCHIGSALHWELTQDRDHFRHDRCLCKVERVHTCRTARVVRCRCDMRHTDKNVSVSGGLQTKPVRQQHGKRSRDVDSVFHCVCFSISALVQGADVNSD